MIIMTVIYYDNYDNKPSWMHPPVYDNDNENDKFNAPDLKAVTSYLLKQLEKV